MSKSAINQRFIESVNYLVSIKKEINKTVIASEIEISKSKFSEILNGRMNVGIEQIIKLSEKFNVSLDYILIGKGEIEKNSNQNLQPVATNEQLNDVDSKKLLLEMSEKLNFVYLNTLKEIAKKELEGLEKDIENSKVKTEK